MSGTATGARPDGAARATTRGRCAAAALAALLAVGLATGPDWARAGELVQDDLIVQGSQCVGVDCEDGEEFGLTTLKLKESHVPIFFDDTSISGAFPRRDWEIVINDPQEGGANFFGIADRGDSGSTSSGENVVFRIQSGAPKESLVIGLEGRVGIGTDHPKALLHVKGSVKVDGTIEASDFVQASSRSYKRDIREIGHDAALEALEGLHPVSYRLNTRPGEATLGFIAEDVPTLVSDSGGKTVNPVEIVAVLVRAFQAQQAVIEAQREDALRLEARISQAEQRLTTVLEEEAK